MLTLQKCLPPIVSSKFIILLVLNFFLANAPGYSQIRGENVSPFNLPLKLCRTYSAPDIETGSVASDNVNLFFSSSGNKINAISLLTGAKEWQSILGGRIRVPLYVTDESIFILSEYEQKNDEDTYTDTYSVRRLSKKNGLVIWKTDLSLNQSPGLNQRSTDFYLHVFGKTLFIVSSSGDIFTIDTVNGGLVGRKFFGHLLSGVPYFNEGKVTFGTLDRRVISISLYDLNKTDDIQTSEIAMPVARIGDLLFWGDERGLITSINYKLRSWKFLTGAKITSMLTSGGNLLVFSLDNFIYSISGRNGRIKWKKRISERFVFTPLVTDYNIIAVVSGLSSVLFIDADSGKTINKVNLSGESFFNGSPVISAALVILPTNTGFLMYSAEGSCSNETELAN